MAEDKVRKTLYKYNANANLVLQAERDGPRLNEPTGEVESLRTKMVGRMGDRVASARPADLDVKLKKMKEKREREEKAKLEELRAKKKSKDRVFLDATGGNVLTETDQFEASSYRPKTKETQAAYELVLAFVRSCIGDQPQEVLRGAADECLSVLKDDGVREPAKQKAVEKVIGIMKSEDFNRLVNYGKAINDFVTDGGAAETADADEDKAAGKLDEGMGVAVVFDDDDEDGHGEDDDGVAVIRDSDDESDDEGGVEADQHGVLAAGIEGDQAEDDKGVAAGGLKVTDIDAYWLQRSLSKFYGDANQSQRYAEDVLGVLQVADERECENGLVHLLGFDKFDFVKLLLRNRAKIVYCTRLKQAQTEEAREVVRIEMRADISGGGAAILEALEKTKTAENWERDRTGALVDRVRKEAKTLGTSDSGTGHEMLDDDALPVAAATSSALRTDQLLDLDALAFKDGSHLMANKRCELPPGSWRAQKKGYEEIHVPAVKRRETDADSLVAISELPEWAREAFLVNKVDKLNRVQSQLCDAALFSNQNLLLCAPTGAGKTNVALLAMLQEIGQHLREDGSVDGSAFKIVYVAPMKALVQECVLKFGKSLAPYGLKVKELSGDQSLTKAEISETQVIITTPEKWDIITRKSGDRTYTQLVRLIIIDEIHLLHDDRGPVLESLVARTIRQVETTQEPVRIVGLSATLPNYEDVAAFLRVDPAKGLFHFDSSFRPCPLQQQFIGVTEKKAIKRFQLMNEICYEKLLEQAGKNQVLVFVHSRKETAKTARALRDMAMERDELDKLIPEASASREVLKDVLEKEPIQNADFKDLIQFGFGIHHAGMNKKDRELAEELFADGHLQVLVSTATLAWGVNLPAHTVIIKGTQIYVPEKGKWTELSHLDVMQMLGRAGRPQFDTFGEGIILTTHGELQYYLSLLNEQLPIESQYIAKLADNLNAEIVLGTVTNLRDAVVWLGYTYLYVRMCRNPTLYGVSAAEIAADPALRQRRVDLIHSAATILDKHGLIRYDRKAGTFQVSTLGRVASHYYIGHPSIATYNEFLKPTLSEIGIFRLFSLSNEFRNIVVREEEKDELRKLIERVPIPVKEGMEEPSAKVNVLLQAYISQLPLDGYALLADMVYVQQSAGRIVRALFEICLKRGWAALTHRMLDLCKMVSRRMWLSHSPLRQFGSALKPDIIRKIEKKDIPWERYYDLSPQDLGEPLQLPKMGKKLHRLIHQFPKLELQAQVQPITRSILKVELTITPDFEFSPDVHGAGEQFWVLVEDVDGETIVHHELFTLKARYASEDSIVSFTIPLSDPVPPQYFIRVVSDRWLHAETVVPISFKHLILPQKFSTATELLDLQPLPVSVLKNKRFQALYKESFTHFNAIQTQVFTSLYDSDENVLVAAPPGSGKTVCAELALLRLFNKDADATAVYIAPLEAIAKERYADWNVKFGAGLDKSVVMLTGETATDLKLLTQAHIVITTPQRWDVLSRRWRVRKSVQAVSLFIVDELHLIGGEAGPTLEVVVSRTRYISSELAAAGHAVRIVGLSASVANAKDLGAWIGASGPSALFHFHPNVRPVPLEIRIQGFDVGHMGARLLAMARPAYGAIVNTCSPGNPALVFVPTRKQAQLSAIDIVTFAGADGRGESFLHAGVDSAKHIVDTLQASGVRDGALLHTASFGVGYLHEGMSAAERRAVEDLYTSGYLGVLAVSVSLVWGFSLTAALVVVMDTVQYDGREHRYIGYPIADMLQIMGRASRPKASSGTCVILCHSSRKEYFKRFLFDPLPVESHLDHCLVDHINAEIVTQSIQSKQDAVDYLTWTFFYRRLAKNPNYYNLQGVSKAHLSDFLSDLVETTLQDLESANCIAIDDMDVSALNLGMIASYYDVSYTTVELFATSVNPKIKTKGLLEILSNSTEFGRLPVRHHEAKTLEVLSKHVPVGMPSDLKRFSDVAIKANVLLQCHFSRQPLTSELRMDCERLLDDAPRLIQAIVDVISSNGWLKPALAVMEMSQMVVQGLWNDSSPLMQIPHMSPDLVSKLAAATGVKESDDDDAGVESVYDIIDLKPDVRASLLGFSKSQLADVARFCNRYPNIAVSFAAAGPDGVGSESPVVSVGDAVTVSVSLAREGTESLDGAGFGIVYAPLYPKVKTENWWLVVGDARANTCLTIKRITLEQSLSVKLEFPAPEEPGSYAYTLYFMSDSYLGCDQVYDFEVTVAEGDGDVDTGVAAADE